MMPYGEERSGFVVRRITSDFIGMAFLGDLLEVRTGILEEKKSSIRLLQEIFRGDELIFSMEITLVYVVAGRPKRIPSKLLEIIHSL